MEEKPPEVARRDGMPMLSAIWRRESGSSRPQSFARRVGGSAVWNSIAIYSSSEGLVKRLAQYGKLYGHKGCVNTVHFNPSGDLLVSGSDDKDIILWDWVEKVKRMRYHSGHLDNVFQARVMPFTDDSTLITSAADGQVRVGKIAESGEVNTKQLGIHRGRVHKLAIEPGSPHVFYSCGEDGRVQHFDLRSHAPTQLFLCTSLSDNKQPVRLNAIVIDPRNPNYFSVGGFDEYARVYDIRSYHLASSNCDQPVDFFSPRHLVGSGNVHITGLSYSNMSELLVSFSDELIYLFEKGMGLGPNPKSASADNLEKLAQPQAYSGHRNSQTIKGVNFFGPSSEYVVSGSDCGHVYIWKKKGGELVCMMVGDKHIVNCIEPHPYFPFLATSGYDKNVKLWTPTGNGLSPLPKNAEEVMAANKHGREARARVTLSPDVIMHVLRLQRRQALAYVEPRPSATDVESDDDDMEAFIVGVANDASEEGGTTADPRECIVS